VHDHLMECLWTASYKKLGRKLVIIVQVKSCGKDKSAGQMPLFYVRFFQLHNIKKLSVDVS
jgi:hypothetical protein